MLRGVGRLRFKFTLTMAAYDLIRLPKLLGRRHDPRNVVRNEVEIGQIKRDHTPRPNCNSRSGNVSINFSGLLKPGGMTWAPPVSRPDRAQGREVVGSGRL
jgi:hypothetical protein